MSKQIVLDIKTVDDIERVKTAILNNENFVLGEIEPIAYTIKLDGGRFKEYDINYIDANVAKVILSHQTNYTKLLNELESNFGIKFNDEDKILKFKLEEGSLEFISKLLKLEGLKNMQSHHLMYVILGLATMWFSHDSFNAHMEKELKQIEIQKEIELKKIDISERESYLQTIDKTVESLKIVSLNKKIQDSINKPKEETLSLLQKDETANIDNTVLKKENATAYEYSKPHIEDIEEDAEFGIYTIESYNFHKNGKLFKLVGVTEMANSEVITPHQRMKLITKAENKEDVKLKVKFIKDGVSKKIKSVYIVDVDFN